MARGKELPPLSESQVEEIERRLRHVFWGSFGLSFLIVVLFIMLLPQWGTLPTAFRTAFQAILLWSLLVTAYGFYSQTRVSEDMKATLKQKTFIDEVTGVFNYRYLDLRLAEETERTRRHGGLTALLYLDLDGFKEVNDQFGHQVGNVVLEQLATTMSQRVRSCDVFGRIGGDEFLVILPQTDRREAYILAERLREAVENYVLEIEDGHVIDFIRVSIGVAAYPVNGETMDNVITAADNAVYESKDQGGNRVSMADEFITSDTVAGRLVDSVRGEPEVEV
ncbi:MAG: GGDEF domain-containing protein [Candidatus Brocadiia bacterium]|jgi:diguanylate cyclase (GGDEF)-like protein